MGASTALTGTAGQRAVRFRSVGLVLSAEPLSARPEPLLYRSIGTVRSLAIHPSAFPSSTNTARSGALRWTVTGLSSTSPRSSLIEFVR